MSRASGGGQFHLVITTGVTPGLAGDGVGEFGFGLKPPGQVIGQEKGAERDFQGPLRHPALADNRPDVVSGRGGDAWIDPGRGPAAPGCTFRSPGLGGFFSSFAFWLILLGPSKLAVGNTMNSAQGQQSAISKNQDLSNRVDSD